MLTAPCHRMSSYRKDKQTYPNNCRSFKYGTCRQLNEFAIYAVFTSHFGNHGNIVHKAHNQLCISILVTRYILKQVQYLMVKIAEHVISRHRISSLVFFALYFYPEGIPPTETNPIKIFVIFSIMLSHVRRINNHMVPK